MSSTDGELAALDESPAGGGTRASTGSIAAEQGLDMQRMRVLDAMAQVAAEQGIRGATVAGVLRQGGISRATFYRLFDDLDDCLQALLDEVLTRSVGLITDAFERESSWPDGVVAGLVALLDFLDAEPALARVCLVDSLAAGSTALERRARELKILEPLLDSGGKRTSSSRRPLALTAESTIAAVSGILHNRLISGDAPPFIDLLGELVGLVVEPWLEPRSVAEEVAKARELALAISHERTCQPPAQHTRVQIPNTLRHPRSHRARSCLIFVGDNPGASNQAVAAGIGLAHHGQVSALLARLAGKGLLVKTPGRPGHPNAWRLTPDGEDVALALALKQRW